MAAIDRVQRQAGQQQVDWPARRTDTTLEKIKKFFSRFEGVATVFTLLTGAACAAIWGVKFGLMAIVGGTIATLAILACRSKPAPQQALQAPVLDPAEQIHPNQLRIDLNALDALDDAGQEAHRANIEALMNFESQILLAIYRQSPHFDNCRALFTYLRDRFGGMDYAGLILHSLTPVRFNGGREGYEIVIRSEVPRGWLRCYIAKERMFDAVEEVRNPQRIERVAPFLSVFDAQRNHLATLNLPFRETGNLQIAFAVDHRNLDLTQLQLNFCRPVRYVHDYRPMPAVHLINHREGYDVEFNTPVGPVRYFVSEDGASVAKPDEVREIRPRQ